MNEKRFPVLGHKTIKSVPWDLVAPHEAQAEINHSQSLERLAERGGSSLDEMIAVISGRHWHGLFEMKSSNRGN